MPVICFLLIAFGCGGSPSRAAEVVASFSQAGSNTKINFAMTNDDAGAIYNSAELRLEASLAPVVDAILRFKPGYSTRSQVYAALGINIQPPPSGEVYLKWFANLGTNTGAMSLYHQGLGPNVWYNTTANAAQDMMMITLNLGAMLDFDGDGQIDDAERLLTLPPLTAAPDEASAGFVGYYGGISPAAAAVSRFAVAGEWVQRAQSLAALTLSRSSGDATLIWQALHGLSYTLQTSPTPTNNPADWTPLGIQQRNSTPGAERAAMSFPHTGAFADARRFYRLVIEVPP